MYVYIFCCMPIYICYICQNSPLVFLEFVGNSWLSNYARSPKRDIYNILPPSKPILVKKKIAQQFPNYIFSLGVWSMSFFLLLADICKTLGSGNANIHLLQLEFYHFSNGINLEAVKWASRMVTRLRVWAIAPDLCLTKFFIT